MSEGRRKPINDEAELQIVSQMLADLNEAERLLSHVHRRAVALGDMDLIHVLDSELFWKLRAAGDYLREHFDLERIYGGEM